jgi:hypothetical protein
MLGGPVRGIAETALRSSCRYSPEILRYFETAAADGRRDPAERALFVRAVCLSGEVHDDALPRATSFLRDPEPALRAAAADALSRGMRIVDGTSPSGDSIVAALRAALSGDPDDGVRRAAFLALSRFDRPDAQLAAEKAAAASSDDAYSSWADTIAGQIGRPDGHALRSTRSALADRQWLAAREPGAGDLRRAASYWVVYHALRRDAMEGSQAARGRLRDLFAELAGSPVVELHERLRLMRDDAARSGLQVD